MHDAETACCRSRVDAEDLHESRLGAGRTFLPAALALRQEVRLDAEVGRAPFAQVGEDLRALLGLRQGVLRRPEHAHLDDSLAPAPRWDTLPAGVRARDSTGWGR